MLSTKEFNRLLKLGNQISKLTTDEERLKFCKKNAKDVKIRILPTKSVIVVSAKMSIEQNSLITNSFNFNQNNVFSSYFENCNGTRLLFQFIGITAEGV